MIVAGKALWQITGELTVTVGLALIVKVPLPGNDGQLGTLLSLTTTDGPLQLIGSGTWGPAGVKFRGEARSAAVDEAALSNLLNIIGRRDGARSIISIG